MLIKYCILSIIFMGSVFEGCTWALKETEQCVRFVNRLFKVSLRMFRKKEEGGHTKIRVWFTHANTFKSAVQGLH